MILGKQTHQFHPDLPAGIFRSNHQQHSIGVFMKRHKNSIAITIDVTSDADTASEHFRLILQSQPDSVVVNVAGKYDIFASQLSCILPPLPDALTSSIYLNNDVVNAYACVLSLQFPSYTIISSFFPVIAMSRNRSLLEKWISIIKIDVKKRQLHNSCSHSTCTLGSHPNSLVRFWQGLGCLLY